jgi:hypothetical protein
MESAEGQRDEDRDEGRTGHDETRDRAVLGRKPTAVTRVPCRHLRPPLKMTTVVGTRLSTVLIFVNKRWQTDVVKR